MIREFKIVKSKNDFRDELGRILASAKFSTQLILRSCSLANDINDLVGQVTCFGKIRSEKNCWMDDFKINFEV